MDSSATASKPHPDYHCPLCPDHEDYNFVWNATLKTMICDGCDCELWNDIAFVENREPDSFILNLLEQHTDLTFDEYRLIELEHYIKVVSAKEGYEDEHLPYFKNEIFRLKSLLRKDS